MSYLMMELLSMIDLLYSCKLCPRNCGINRMEEQIGFCKSGFEIKVARAALHHWEEPCLSGENGSGTVFFSECNLKCVFCQNHSISHKGVGKVVSIERLADIFIEQQERGAHNINLVTPTHFVPQIIEAIKLARGKGLNLPIVYNSNGYENVDTIKALKGYVDIYLPDLKYYDDKYAIRYSHSPNYFNIASKAIEEMFSQMGTPEFDEKGMMMRGVIIRHLMLPGLLFDSKKIMDYIWNTFGDSVYISIMNQYTPVNNVDKYPEINKSLNQAHYESLIQYCLSLGVKNAFIQEEGTVSESFIPDFDLRGV
jgi:putative pyruvate formate lyase activating enzyme